MLNLRPHPPAAGSPAARTGAPQTPATSGAGPRPPPRLLSSDLMGQAPEIEILHGDALYRLRRTALGKLILTK